MTTTAHSDALSRTELRRRASAGMFISASWGLLNLVFGFFGNLVLARLLLPRDFGLVAVGMTFVAFATAVSDGGLGGGFLRRPETPRRHELRTLLGVQLSLTGVLAVAIAICALPFGRTGAMVAVMITSLPLTALQTPGRMMLARSLLYQRMAMVDAVGLIVYYGWSIGGVIAGFGVWALATGAVARALAGSAVIGRASGLGVLFPSLRGVRALGHVFRFGIRFQAVSMTMVVRDQSLNAATGLIAGVATLGLWSFMSRLMQIPLVFFESLWRVSFPAMSQLLAAKEDPRRAIERGVALSSVAAGLMLTTFAGAAPELVPGVFGGQWSGATAIVPWACLALLVSGPVSVSTVGYLYAMDRPGGVLRASVALAATWFVVAIGLLPFLGISALGIGWLAGSVADAVILARSTKKLCDVSIVSTLVVPISAATASGALGWMISSTGTGFTAGLTGGAAAAIAYLAAMFLLRRALLLETLAAVGRSVSNSLPARTSARGIQEPA